MSEESDRVWERMSGELRKVRRRRFFVKAGTLVVVGVLGVFLAQRALVTVEGPGDQLVDVPVAPIEQAVYDDESVQLAVLVFDGEGMRFELMGAERLSSSEMEFSLQPVVMGLESGAW